MWFPKILKKLCPAREATRISSNFQVFLKLGSVETQALPMEHPLQWLFFQVISIEFENFFSVTLFCVQNTPHWKQDLNYNIFQSLHLLQVLIRILCQSLKTVQLILYPKLYNRGCTD